MKILLDIVLLAVALLFWHLIFRPTNIRDRLRRYKLRQPQVIRMGSKSDLWFGNGKLLDKNGYEVQTIPLKDKTK